MASRRLSARMRSGALPLLCSVTTALLGSSAVAHDTWFEPLADHTVALGTGIQFPKRDSGIASEYLKRRGCDEGASMSRPKPDTANTDPRPLRNSDDALLLAVPPAARSCWAQLTPFDIELAPEKVGIYIDEIHPTPEFLGAWADMQRRGMPWRERYTKHARIEFGGGADAARPSNMDMDAIVQGIGVQPTVGTRIDFIVLLRGKPLPNFNVQFRSERTPFGFWRRTDAEGRVDFQPPLPGRWLLRGVDIRPSPSRPDSFESDFLTLSFGVAARTAAP